MDWVRWLFLLILLVVFVSCSVVLRFRLRLSGCCGICCFISFVFVCFVWRYVVLCIGWICWCNLRMLWMICRFVRFCWKVVGRLRCCVCVSRKMVRCVGCMNLVRLLFIWKVVLLMFEWLINCFWLCLGVVGGLGNVLVFCFCVLVIGGGECGICWYRCNFVWWWLGWLVILGFCVLFWCCVVLEWVVWWFVVFCWCCCGWCFLVWLVSCLELVLCCLDFLVFGVVLFCVVVDVWWFFWWYGLFCYWSCWLVGCFCLFGWCLLCLGCWGWLGGCCVVIFGMLVFWVVVVLGCYFGFCLGRLFCLVLLWDCCLFCCWVGLDIGVWYWLWDLGWIFYVVGVG